MMVGVTETRAFGPMEGSSSSWVGSVLVVQRRIPVVRGAPDVRSCTDQSVCREFYIVARPFADPGGKQCVAGWLRSSRDH